MFCYFFALFSFKKSCQSSFPSVILGIPSGAELRFNCEICIVTQQINSPISHRPFTAEGHFSYKSFLSRSQQHQHFAPLRKVIRRKIPAACRVSAWLCVSVWGRVEAEAGWGWLTGAIFSPAASLRKAQGGNSMAPFTPPPLSARTMLGHSKRWAGPEHVSAWKSLTTRCSK